MEIRDKNNKLLAMIFSPNDYKDEKHFLTKDSNEFQIAQFNLDEATEIKRHIHKDQENLKFLAVSERIQNVIESYKKESRVIDYFSDDLVYEIKLTLT